MTADIRAKLRQQFLDQPFEKHAEKWDDLWQQNITPWDRNGPSPALRDAVTSSAYIRPPWSPHGNTQGRKRALVPGCGRGYDVLLLSSLGYETFGLDASQTAVDAARRLQKNAAHDEKYAVYDEQTGRGAANFILADFFKDDFLSQTSGGNFDLIFDYTFLCALPPELRPAWARRMSELLAEDGSLVCLEWPLQKDPKQGGPPHGLTSRLYVELLKSPGDDVQYDANGFVVDTGHVKDRPDTMLERRSHYEPLVTHEATQGQDSISIWKHKQTTH